MKNKTKFTCICFASLLLIACNVDNTNSNKTKMQPAQKKSEFWIFDGSTDGKEYNLWVTDGTEAGTKELHSEYTMKSTPGKDWMIKYSDKLVFLARPESEHDHVEHKHHEMENKNEHEHRKEKNSEAPHLLISDGSKKGTKRLLGNSVNSFEYVASPFFEINNM